MQLVLYIGHGVFEYMCLVFGNSLEEFSLGWGQAIVGGGTSVQEKK